MLRFREYITEAWEKGTYKVHNGEYSYHDHQHLKKTLIPALREKSTGKVLIGKRGKTHSDIYDQHHLPIKSRDTYNNYGWGQTHEAGYVHPETKTFHPRQKIGFDSTDLMTPHQLRKYENSY